MPGLDESKEFVPLKIAVLTISDTRDLKDDKSGALLVQRIVAADHFIAERSIVTDDVQAIRARVKAWIADPVIDVIITTGGTGFRAATSPRKPLNLCSTRRWTPSRRCSWW